MRAGEATVETAARRAQTTGARTVRALARVYAAIRAGGPR